MEAEKKLYVFAGSVYYGPNAVVLGTFMASSRDDVLKCILSAIRAYARHLTDTANNSEDGSDMFSMPDTPGLSDIVKKGREYFLCLYNTRGEAWGKAGIDHEYDRDIALKSLVRGGESTLDKIIEEAYWGDRKDTKLSLTESSPMVI